MRYYVYGHTLKDGTLFYIGHGSGKRYKQTSRSKEWKEIVKNNEGKFYFIIIKNNLLYKDAIKLEEELIIKYGRKCNNTGILINKSIGIGAKGLKGKEASSSIPIYVLNLNNEIINEFNSIVEASDFYKIKYCYISYCTSGKIESYNDMKFIKKEEYLNRNKKKYNFKPIKNVKHR